MNKIEIKTPDFRYPADVAKDANATLKEAIAQRDGHAIIASLVQLGLAKTAVSKNNLAEVCQQIDQVLAVDGLLAPDMRSMAYLLKSTMLHDAPRAIDLPEGMTTQWQQVIDPLDNGDISALKRPLSEYTDLIVPGNEWGSRCIPTLYDFLMLQVSNQSYLDYEKRQQWLAMHMVDEDVMPRLFIERYIATGGYYSTWSRMSYIRDEIAKLYEKYASYPESGLLLICDYPEDKDYSILQDYLKRHADCDLSKNVQNQIDKIESANVNITYPSLIQSTDGLKVTAHSRNVNEITLTLYRLNKMPEMASYQDMQVSDFKEIQKRTIHTEGKIPFDAYELETTFDPVPFGHYIVLASYLADGEMRSLIKLSESNVYSSMVNVSDIRTFCISPTHIIKNPKGDQITHDPAQVFAVNSQSGAPVSEAVVSYNNSYYISRSKKEYQDVQTNADGFITIDNASHISYKISKDNDNCLPEYQQYVAGSNRTFHDTSLEVYTDLGIYRPGETIRFLVVAWYSGYFQSHPTSGLKLVADFVDASGNKIETKQFTTDAMGQAVSEFAIPTDRMNGRFSIRVKSQESQDSYSKTKYIDVSEYKTPTFYVDLSETSTTQLAGEKARIVGRVMTYSGMPVAETEVSCRLSARSWWWFDNESDFSSRTFTVKTDKEGRFEYLCPEDWFETGSTISGHRRFLIYSVLATCTNAAGETHQGSSSFTIGSARGLVCSEGTYCIKAGEPVDYYIDYLSSDKEKQPVRCHYELSRVEGKDTTLVLAEDFMSNEEKFNWDKVPSGEYIIKANIIGDEEAVEGKAQLILYRETDALPPVQSSLFLPYKSRYMDEQGHIRVLLGTSHPSHIYYIIEDRSHILKSGWMTYKPGLHWFTTDMPMEADQRIGIHFYTVYQGETFDEEASFTSPKRNEVQLSAVSFRDKIMPGQTEHWTFKLTDSDGNPVQGGRMMLELYNEALESLSANPWHIYTSRYMYGMHSHYVPHYNGSSTSMSYQANHGYAATPEIQLPSMNLYNHSFFSPVIQKSRALGGMNSMMYVEDDAVMLESAPMASVEAMARPSMMKAAMASEEEEVVVEEKKSMSDVAVRSSEVKVAYWQPQLTSDAEGNFSVEFDVPNFNTTYHFQALSYSSDMLTSSITKKVLAQRSVMVQPSLPRFLRTGDTIDLATNVMNASDSTLQIETLIELFDPRTNEILKSSSRTLTLESHATEVLRISYEAPQDAPYVGFRVKAISTDGNGDGEQQLLPILSNITPIIETQPFYMQPETMNLGLDVDQSHPAEGSRLTLEYCNNPTWYCVTALPSLIDVDAITSPALAHNLFALSLTSKLSAENPLMAEAIRSWKKNEGKEGDVLVSQLLQNDDLKIGSLLASPWLPEAQRQQLRMQALDQLFDQKRNEQLMSKLIAALQRLQAKDGGFLWLDFDGSRKESSYWATAQVLELLGDLNHLGCLPDNAQLRSLISDALHYYDDKTIEIEQEMIAEAKKYKTSVSYLSFWTYVYVRQMLKDISGYSSKSVGKAIFKITDKTLNELEKDWGELDMTSRARAAVTLYRNGRESKARGVMESVRQFALHDPYKGMYWESLDTYGFYPVACTSAMLQSFAEVSPRKEEIDEMRQWLLLEKQTTDWGSSSMAIDAVYSILSTGSDWLHASSVDSIPQFQILVDGKPVDVSDSDCHLGYIRMSLPADTKRVEFSRSGVNPAWGSLYHQFKAPMTEVKAKGVTELNIEKLMSRVDTSGATQKLSEGDTLHIGDRIRITLRIKSTKDMEYVTVVDQRPAFLEPVDQKSHYERGNSFYYYLETKDSQSNAFITYLPDGLHEISYDCFVTAPGTFTSGVATVQSQYAPQFVAHSAGASIITNY